MTLAPVAGLVFHPARSTEYWTGALGAAIDVLPLLGSDDGRGPLADLAELCAAGGGGAGRLGEGALTLDVVATPTRVVWIVRGWDGEAPVDLLRAIVAGLAAVRAEPAFAAAATEESGIQAVHSGLGSAADLPGVAFFDGSATRRWLQPLAGEAWRSAGEGALFELAGDTRARIADQLQLDEHDRPPTLSHWGPEALRREARLARGTQRFARAVELVLDPQTIALDRSFESVVRLERWVRSWVLPKSTDRVAGLAAYLRMVLLTERGADADLDRYDPSEAVEQLLRDGRSLQQWAEGAVASPRVGALFSGPRVWSCRLQWMEGEAVPDSEQALGVVRGSHPSLTGLPDPETDEYGRWRSILDADELRVDVSWDEDTNHLEISALLDEGDAPDEWARRLWHGLNGVDSFYMAAAWPNADPAGFGWSRSGFAAGAPAMILLDEEAILQGGGRPHLLGAPCDKAALEGSALLLDLQNQPPGRMFAYLDWDADWPHLPCEVDAATDSPPIPATSGSAHDDPNWGLEGIARWARDCDASLRAPDDPPLSMDSVGSLVRSAPRDSSGLSHEILQTRTLHLGAWLFQNLCALDGAAPEVREPLTASTVRIGGEEVHPWTIAWRVVLLDQDLSFGAEIDARMKDE